MDQNCLLPLVAKFDFAVPQRDQFSSMHPLSMYQDWYKFERAIGR